MLDKMMVGIADLFRKTVALRSFKLPETNMGMDVTALDVERFHQVSASH